MTTVRELHDRAMKLAQQALLARHSGEWIRAKQLANEGYLLESQAAAMVPKNESSEPTRSILYRSAASLAYQAKNLEAAQRLIFEGLTGYPPATVERELKHLYEQVDFENHLKTHGVILDDADLQLALRGNAVGSGMIFYSQFVKRIDATFAVLDRTTQRLMGREYQRTGRPPKLFRPFTNTLSVPREGSFAVTIRLAFEDNQQLPMLITASQVIEEFLAGVDLINEANESELKERIKQDGYYRNFVSLVKSMAPDGERIGFIGFTSAKRSVSLTRQQKSIETSPVIEEDVATKPDRSPIQIEGLLDFATSRERNVIGLTTEDNKQYNIPVEEGLDDLVRTYFKQWVIVTGESDGRYVYLKEIQLSGE